MFLDTMDPIGGEISPFPIAAPPPFHDLPWMLRGAGWPRGTVWCARHGNKHRALGTSLVVTTVAQARRAGLDGITPPPRPPCGSIQTLVCIVLYLYVDVRPSRHFFFCFVFVKKNSPLGTITTTILITLNYYYPYLLPVAPVYFDILLFMLKLCCVALPIDRSFSVFNTV